MTRGEDALGRAALALGLVASAALAAAGVAAAHVTLKPAFAPAGSEVELAVEAPNERDEPMTELELGAPAGIGLLAAAGPDGWTGVVRGDRAVWSGSTLAADATVELTVRLRAEGEPRAVVLRAVQRYADGGAVDWDVPLTVTPADAAATPAQHPGRALVAAGVGLLVIALSFAVLRRLRRRPLQDG